MIRVLLAEDDEVFRLGLTVSLQKIPEIDLVGSCPDGQSAIELTEQLQPDLILMDIGLPIINGIEATSIVKEKYPHIKILVLTSHSEPKVVEEMMAAGADGYCIKGISTERLNALIFDVFQGNLWIDASVAEQMKHYFKQSKKNEPSSPISPTELKELELLTERELEVLQLIAQGKKNQDIADTLYISPGTVRVHVHSILHKLNVKDRTQAALFIIKQQYPNP